MILPYKRGGTEINMGKIRFFDTTLRDGEQTPGVNFNTQEKTDIAKRLEKIGVDVIEAGFAASSSGDFNAIKEIAGTVKNSYVCSLARMIQSDIDAAWEAVRLANLPYIHTFIATSDIHMKYKLNMSEDVLLMRAVDGVRYAKKFCNEVEFSAEDASRSRPEFLYKILEAVIAAGATCINVPDTVGYANPSGYANLICGIRENVRGIENVYLSVHCHNDLGMATANTLAAIAAGANQAECTINGLGERAGNTSFEEVVMGMYTRPDLYSNVKHGIDTKQISRISKLVSSISGVNINPLKPIVGANAFAHESGIHQDGVLKNPLTYEIMTPSVIGLGQTRLALGKLSGRAAFKNHIENLGYTLQKEEIDKAFAKFKELADKKKEVKDDDIEAIINEHISKIPETFTMTAMQITSGNNMIATATVTMKKDEQTFTDAATGDGPLDAIFKTIQRMTNVFPELKTYQLRAVTDGTDALSEATVMITVDEKPYRAKAVSVDVLESSAKAYLNAINRSLFQTQN